MCRGDRREAIFLDDRDREIFLATLGEVCERCGFIVHSYVLLSNHYHLLMETPAGNLVAGMRWFQGTYTARFNARHRLAGHLFAGRYKAVLVEREEPAYGRVVSDYIHLNPARAGIVNAENPRLRAYRWSSFPGFCGQGTLPGWLRAAEVYCWHHLDWRRSVDRKAFERDLQTCARESWGARSASGSQEIKVLRSGWVLGSEAFRDRMKDLAADIVKGKRRESYTGEEISRHDELAARKLLDRGLDALRIALSDLRLLRQNDPRKQALAWLIRTKTIVADDWITQHLDMGHRSNVSRAVSALRSPTQPPRRRLRRTLHACTD